jgi:CO/xanthine dehydrogenase Mo-binding subunit
MATLGSRSTFHMGNAVRRAAEDARAQLFTIAADALKTSVDELECFDGGVRARGGTGTRLSFRDVMLARFAMQAGTIVGFGSYAPTYEKPDPATGMSPNITPFWMLGGAGAEIEVDTETGRVTVTKLVNVADVGRAINPSSVERQLTGAAIMQTGFTLFEEMLFSDGQVLNASLADYKIPGFFDVPRELVGSFVEVPHREGPFGAKGVGETGVFSPSPAIANALYDATGVMLHDMPLTPERVLRALRERDGHPLGNE